jgi:DMSO reductase anchor subunit
MTGCVLFNALLQPFALGFTPLLALAFALTVLGWAWKIATWRHNDGLGVGTTLNSATGLTGGEVRSLEWPHTEDNYLLKEMGFRIARKHSVRLRLIAQALAFGLPLLLLAAAFGLSAVPWLSVSLSLIATVSQLAGMLVERWLFFAEAKHTVALYYGR